MDCPGRKAVQRSRKTQTQESSQEKTIQELKRRIKEFIHQRAWEQYHAPKNLAKALSVEVTEIPKFFQWKDSGAELTEPEQQALQEEIDAVMIYLLELAEKFGIDPFERARQKLILNEKKYPAEVVRGRAEKYTKYRERESDQERDGNGTV